MDGKNGRRSGSRRHDHGLLHLVSAWASGQGLALGQRAVDGQSNEIVAIPALLETLHLSQAILLCRGLSLLRGEPALDL